MEMAMVTTRKRKKLEGQIWRMRRLDSDSSESDGDCVTKTYETVPSKLSPKRKKPAATVHPSDRSKKSKTLEVVPLKPHPSDQSNKSQQAQSNIDGMNPQRGWQNSEVTATRPPAHRDTGKSVSGEDLLSSGPLFKEQQLTQLKAQCYVFLAFKYFYKLLFTKFSAMVSPKTSLTDFLGNISYRDDGFGRYLFDHQKGSAHPLSESGSIHQVSAPSARLDNPTGRLAEMDFSSKETEMARLEDEISKAVSSDGQKLLRASKIPDSQVQNQVSGSHSELAYSSEAEGSGVRPAASSEKEAEESGGDRVGAESASTVSGSENEAEESNGGAGVQHKGGNSESDLEAEESDGDRATQEKVKTPEIVPSKRCAKRRAVYPSDPMKKSREALDEIGRLNPESSLPPHRPYNKSFLTKKNRFRFDSFWKKGVVDQRLVDLGSYASLGVEQILKDNRLLSTVTCVEPYVLEVVMEFYANLPGKEETDRLVQRIFVRGHMYELSPKLINSVLKLRQIRITRPEEFSTDVDLNLIAATLTGGKVKDWKKITPAYLTPPVAALHVMCCANWIPTSNACSLSEDRAKFLYMLLQKTPFNFGKLAYDEIIRSGQRVGTNFKVVLPALIYQVLNYQRAIHLRKGEALNHLAKPICYHIRLSRGKHVSLPSPSGRKGKHASLPSNSGRKGKYRSLPSPSRRKAELKSYVDKAMALLHIVNDRLEGDDVSDDEEETDDDEAGTE